MVYSRPYNEAYSNKTKQKIFPIKLQNEIIIVANIKTKKRWLPNVFPKLFGFFFHYYNGVIFKLSIYVNSIVLI